MQLIGVLIAFWEIKIRILPNIYLFFKYQPRGHKAGRNLKMLYVEYNYMTKDINKIWKSHLHIILSFKKYSPILKEKRKNIIKLIKEKASPVFYI